VGQQVYAFQFHLEVDRALADAWATRLPAGVQIDEEHRADVERTGRAVLGRFFEAGLAGPAK
jgi:GMP synthase-like glutamine amidotransferase